MSSIKTLISREDDQSVKFSFEKAVNMRRESTELMMDYWKKFSIYTTFEFWMLVGLFLVPLIVLIWKIDKSKIFQICFYGYGVHMFSFYISLFGVNLGLWSYPIQFIPATPSLSFDSSFVPVTYMLVYQWTLNKKRNFYLLALIISIFFSFVIDPLLVKMEMFKMFRGINYLHRFLGYVVASFSSILITNLFLWLQKRYIKST